MFVFEQDCYWVMSHELLTATTFNLALNYVNGNQKLFWLSSFLWFSLVKLLNLWYSCLCKH